jgi:hypothetical protein
MSRCENVGRVGEDAHELAPSQTTQRVNDRGALRIYFTLDHIPRLATSPSTPKHTPHSIIQSPSSTVNHVRNLQNASCRRTQTVAERSPLRELSDLTPASAPLLVPFRPLSRHTFMGGADRLSFVYFGGRSFFFLAWWSRDFTQSPPNQPMGR